ncbi:MAG TPA: hypothetical protein V6C84_13910, partial [Coleofasciculaceae cyanobacterium]
MQAILLVPLPDIARLIPTGLKPVEINQLSQRLTEFLQCGAKVRGDVPAYQMRSKPYGLPIVMLRKGFERFPLTP